MMPRTYIIILIVLILIYLIFQYLHSVSSLKTAEELSQFTFNGEFKKGKGKNFTILVDGDSVGAGVGASSKETSVSGRILDYYSKNYSVKLKNQAKSGSKMYDLTNRTIDKKYNLTILIVSSNDVFRFSDINTFRNATKKVLKRYLEKSDKVILVGPGMVDTTSGIPIFMKPVYRYKATKYYRILEEETSKHKNLAYVNPYKNLHLEDYGDTEAADNFHPNDEGHLYWSDLVKVGIDKLEK